MNRTKRLTAMVVFAFVAMGVMAVPAWAHQNQITGEGVCNPQTGQYDVTWRNHGDAARFGDATITASSRASVATGQTIPADTTVVVGTESVPGTTTSLSLTETWFWPKDSFHNTNTGSLTLVGDCTPPHESHPKAFANCEHIWLNNSESNVDVTFDVNGELILVPAGTVTALPSPGDQAHVVITVGETVLFDQVLDCAHTAPKATARAKCVGHHPTVAVVLDNSGSNRDITFDISVNGTISRHVQVTAGVGQRVTLDVSVGDQIEVTVGNDVLASTVVEACTHNKPKPPPNKPPTRVAPRFGGTAFTGPSIKRPMFGMFALLLLGATLLRVSRRRVTGNMTPVIASKRQYIPSESGTLLDTEGRA